VALGERGPAGEGFAIEEGDGFGGEGGGKGGGEEEVEEGAHGMGCGGN